jgi:tripartite-type tricarboxylate transporter receptor subunit TctC
LWAGLYAPAATPKEIVSLLNREAVNVLKLGDVRQRLDATGITPVGSTPEQFGTLVRNEIEKWAKVVKTAGMRPD